MAAVAPISVLAGDDAASKGRGSSRRVGVDPVQGSPSQNSAATESPMAVPTRPELLASVKARPKHRDGVDLRGKEDPVFQALMRQAGRTPPLSDTDSEAPAPAGENGLGSGDVDSARVEFVTLGRGSPETKAGAVEAGEGEEEGKGDDDGGLHITADFLEAQRQERLEKLKAEEEEAKAKAEEEERLRIEEENRKKIPEHWWYAVTWWQDVEWESDMGPGWGPLVPGCGPKNSRFDRLTCTLSTTWTLICVGAIIVGLVFLHDPDHRVRGAMFCPCRSVRLD